jgi:hypothetical protein
MLYNVIWIAVVDITLLNLDFDRKLWHVRELVVLLRGVTLLRGGVIFFLFDIGYDLYALQCHMDSRR